METGLAQSGANWKFVRTRDKSIITRIIRQAGAFGHHRSILSFRVRVPNGNAMKKPSFLLFPSAWKKKRSSPLWEIAYAGCRLVMRSRERKPARWARRTRRITCGAPAVQGAPSGPVLKVYQALSTPPPPLLLLIFVRSFASSSTNILLHTLRNTWWPFAR